MKKKVLTLTYRITPDGLVEYSVQIPSHRARSPSGQKYGADIEWILAGKNSSVLYQGCSLSECTIKSLTGVGKQLYISGKARSLPFGFIPIRVPIG
jgi:hypothetical protein